jgi:hypothetical protein
METNAIGCVNKGISVSTGACDEQLPIKIKECSGFYIYYLEPPTTCDTAYCFGETYIVLRFEKHFLIKTNRLERNFE